MNKSKNKLLITLIAVVIVFGLALGAAALYKSKQNPTTSSQRSPELVASETGRTEISYSATPGISALQQLRSEAEDVVVLESEYGQLIDSIEGHKGGADGKYWSFYVNGEMAQVGAGDYVQKKGDVIEWKFQKL